MADGNHAAEEPRPKLPKPCWFQPRPWHWLLPGRGSSNRSQVAFQKLQEEKKKKLRERNQSEWVCCSGALFTSDRSDGNVMTC